MHLRTLTLAIASALALAAVACDESGQPTAVPDDGGSGGGGSSGGGGGGGAPSDFRWVFTGVDDDNGGTQVQVAAAPGGGVGMAYFRKTPNTDICNAPRTGEAFPVDLWEVKYASGSAGAFTTEVVETIELSGFPRGLSLAFDEQGNPAVAYEGGTQGALQCGGTDMMLARRQGGAWAVQTVAVDGNGSSYVYPEDGVACEAYQGTCYKGDVVGLWPALAFVGGQPVIAYRDVHFGGLGVDSEKNADVELLWQGGQTSLEVTYGGGLYTRIAVGGSGTVAVAHFNPNHQAADFNGGDYVDGIWVYRWDGSAWERQKVVDTMDVGYTLGLAASGTKLGLAYRDDEERRLVYLQADDGVTWGTPVIVDQAGNTGLSPALVFDGGGRAWIAYHRCGPAGSVGEDCAAGDDSLKLAIQDGGTFRVTEVRNESGGQDGESVSLALDVAGNPVIAYQAVYFDPVDQLVRRKLVVGEGTPR